MTREISIIADTREQWPLPFPDTLSPFLSTTALPSEARADAIRIRVVKKALEVADYVLDGDPGAVYVETHTRGAGVVERKGSIDELGVNVFSERRREAFVRLLRRMRERFAHPILLVEGGLTTLLGTPPTRGKVPAGLVIDGLLRLSFEYGVPIQLVDGRSVSQRRYLGEYVARFLANAAVVGNAVCPLSKTISQSPPSDSSTATTVSTLSGPPDSSSLTETAPLPKPT